MKNEVLAKAVGAVMSPKVRMGMKVVSGLIWIASKGIDIYDGYATKIDQELYIDHMVEASIKDITGIKQMAQDEAKKEVRKEIARAMAKSGTKNDEIARFLKSLDENKAG